MQGSLATKTWARTGHRNLIRHKSGRYYARAFAGGKEVWQSLKTSHYSVARARLGEFLKEHRGRASNGNGEVSAKMTFGEAAAIHPDAKMSRVRDCQKALNRACKKVGTDRITHHDLRHFFATRRIEIGVDIPTVSRRFPLA